MVILVVNMMLYSVCSQKELLTIANPTAIPSLIECIASDYAVSHSRKWGHANRHQVIHIRCV